MIPDDAQSARLLPQHLALIEASAINAQVAEERGYRSVTDLSELLELGFASAQRRVPGLLIPVRDIHGNVAYHQLRPDEPREKDGKPVKYETAAKGSRASRGLPAAGIVIDVPTGIRSRINDPRVPLWATEGSRKADAAVSAGLCCVALIGVWGFRLSKKEDPSQGPLPDWDQIALAGRRVYVVFDSDMMIKSSVHKALAAFKAFLDERGADVRLIYLPGGPDGEKVGLDDFLVAGGTVPDLFEHATAELIDRQVVDQAAHKPPMAKRLVEYALSSGAEFFHTPTGIEYATVPAAGHGETLPIDSPSFRRWLGRGLHSEGDVATGAQLTDAVNHLKAEAFYSGVERPVSVRVGGSVNDAAYIDPALRSIPDKVSNLMIAANSNRILAYDNLSSISAQLSDALCSISTGGGYAVRALYTDFDEAVYDAVRPLILTGIDALPRRPDLLERALLIELNRIDPSARQTEEVLWKAFKAARGRILGALLDGAVSALANRNTVELTSLPRMADFALLATAAEADSDLSRAP